MIQLILKRAGILSMLCLALSSFNAQAQENITLQAAVDRALANNLTIKQAKVTESIGALDLQQSKNNQLPSLNANPSAGYYFGKNQISGDFAFVNSTNLNVNAQATMQLTLFQGGQLRNQILQNKILLDVNRSSTAKLQNDLILNVVTTYLQILTNQDLVTAAQQQIELANQTLSRSEISFKVGNQTLADLSQAKAQVSTATLNLTNAQNQLDISVLILKQYMEMDPATNITVEKPDVSKLTDIKTVYDASDVVKTALSVNPDVRLAETQQRSYLQAIAVAKGSYFPTLSLVGALNSTYSNQARTVSGATYLGLSTTPIGIVQPSGDKVYAPMFKYDYTPIPFGTQFNNNFNQYVGLNLQIPIFNKFSVHTSVARAKLNYNNAQLNTQIAKNNLSKTITQAVLDLRAADKQYQSATQTFEANKAALNVTKQRYDVGLVNSLDYNTAITNFNKSQNDMILARYSMIFRSKIIDYYLGNTITLDK